MPRQLKGNVRVELFLPCKCLSLIVCVDRPTCSVKALVFFVTRKFVKLTAYARQLFVSSAPMTTGLACITCIGSKVTENVQIVDKAAAFAVHACQHNATEDNISVTLLPMQQVMHAYLNEHCWLKY